MLNVSVRPQVAAVAAVSALAATAGEMSSDQFLVEQIAAGSRPAMQALFARHRTYVYRWLLRFVSNEALAEDLLSEVFLDVWRQAGRSAKQHNVTQEHTHTLASPFVTPNSADGQFGGCCCRRAAFAL